MARRCTACGEEIAGPDTHVCRPALERPAKGGPRVGDVLAGRWVLKERAGSGGGGVVFCAYDRDLDIQVGLKILPPGDLPEALVRRFKREIRLTRDVDHPNVCRVFDLGRDGGLTFLTMRWIDGEPLSTRVEAGGPLAGRALGRLAHGLVAALAETHRRGVVHRDVKPANVMVSPDGDPVLLDYGIAVALSSDDPITIQGATPGTHPYIAPELAAGGKTTPAADLWGLALTLAYAATGVSGPPRDPAATFAALGRPLGPLVARSLDEDPARRPADAAAIETALRRRGRLRAGIALGAVALGVLAAAVTAGDFVVRRAAAPAGPPVVRVDPLVNDTGDPALDWMRRGVADLVAATLESGGVVRIEAGGSGGRAAHIEGHVTRRDGQPFVDLVLRDAGGRRLGRERLRANELLAGVEAAARRFSTALGVRTPPVDAARRPPPLASDFEAFASFARARDLLREHKDLLALDELRRATERDPAFALAQLERYAVLSFGQHGSHAEMTAALSLARAHRDRLPPSERELLDGVVEAVDHGRPDRIRAYLRSHAPESSTYLMAFRAMRNVDDDSKREVLLEWASRLPTDPEPHNQLGYLLIERDPAAAEHEFLEYVRLAPRDANAHDSYGDFLRSRARLSEARTEYDRAAALDPLFAHSVAAGVEVAVALDDLPDAERRLARLGGVVSVDEVSYQTWVWSAAALPLLRNDVAGALGGLERVARDPRIGSRAYLAREYEAIVRGLSGEIGPARRAAEEAARLSALYHGRAAEPDGLAPYVAGLAAHRRADRATLARASAELAEAQGTLAAARAALVAALLDASEDRPTEAALGLAGIESLHGGVNFLAALERARLLVEVGRNAEADVAYDAAVDRRAESQLAPEVAFDWRACLVEASARAHARGDEAKAAALAARLAALDQR